jgi:capsid portal protein
MSGSKIEKADGNQVISSLIPSYPLFRNMEGKSINQAIAPEKEANSNVASQSGTKELQRPLDMEATIRLKDMSTHHLSCIQTKKNATVGLGFYGKDELIETGKSLEQEIGDANKNTSVAQIVSLLQGNQRVNSKVDDELDPLTVMPGGFAQELDQTAEDFMDTGTGYLEVVRGNLDNAEEITYVGWIRASTLTATTVDGRLRYYKYVDPSGGTKYWPLFGLANKEWMFTEGPYKDSKVTRDKVSEIIPFILPSNRVKYYGYPDWLAGAVDIDLVRLSKQYKADFFHNRGVLDFILTIIGDKLSKEQLASVENMIKGSIGEGNNYKSGVLQFQNKDVKVQVDKLAMEAQTEEQFAKDSEVFSQNIVSAHRIPPLLANILIPGKLGATNEYINALIGAQLLTFGPYQQIFQRTLSRTLGNPDENGGLGLGPEDFRLRTVTSQINITGLDTVSRMRSEATSPENADRDMEDGVKD